MKRVILAGPAVEPITLAEAKAHLRLDGADEDGVVAALVTAARIAVERATRLVLIEQSWRLVLDRWPPGRVLRLPFAPVLAVTSVKVTPVSGLPATIDPALYRLEREGDDPRLVPDPSVPDPGIAAGGVAIEMRCGFGPAPADVPAPLRLATHQLVTRWFAHRGDEAGGRAVLPDEVRALLAPFARPRLAP